jgi:hypothetical protein
MSGAALMPWFQIYAESAPTKRDGSVITQELKITYDCLFIFN